MCQVNDSVTFNEKPIRSEEFFNQIIEALGIIIDRRPKEDLVKWKSKISHNEGILGSQHLTLKIDMSNVETPLLLNGTAYGQ